MNVLTMEVDQLLDHNRTGFLFQPDEKDGLFSALTLLSNDENRRKSIGQMAQQSIQDRNLLWTANAQKSIDLIKSLKR